jgi:hypothetical protein
MLRHHWIALGGIISTMISPPTAAGAQSADASLCKLLPIDHIERLFGAKAGKPTGTDLMPNIGNCSVQAPDGKHLVIISTASLAGQTRGIEERTKLGLKMMESSKAPKSKAEYQFFGDVVCSTEELTPPMKQATCMTDRGQRQFNFLVRSDTAAHFRVDEIRQLLQEAVAKVK